MNQFIILKQPIQTVNFELNCWKSHLQLLYTDTSQACIMLSKMGLKVLRVF